VGTVIECCRRMQARNTSRKPEMKVVLSLGFTANCASASSLIRMRNRCTWRVVDIVSSIRFVLCIAAYLVVSSEAVKPTCWTTVILTHVLYKGLRTVSVIWRRSCRKVSHQCSEVSFGSSVISLKGECFFLYKHPLFGWEFRELSPVQAPGL